MQNRGVTTLAERGRVLRRWTESVLPAQTFSPIVGLFASSLCAWRWRERRRVAEFVELEVTARNRLRAMTTEPERPASLEIALPRGVLVRVPDEFDPAMLRRVVDALVD